MSVPLKQLKRSKQLQNITSRNNFKYIVTITNIILFKVTAAIINKVNLTQK